MLRWMILLLPALIPSWRFFQTIEPSPRIEYRVHGDRLGSWRPMCPQPDRVSPGQMMIHLVWNPARNDALFLTSCAERILVDGRDHAKQEILRRIRDIEGITADDIVQFRLVTVQRVGNALERSVAYTSCLDGPRHSLGGIPLSLANAH